MFTLQLPKKFIQHFVCCVNVPPITEHEPMPVVQDEVCRSSCGLTPHFLIFVAFILTLFAFVYGQDRGDGIVKMLGLPAP